MKAKSYLLLAASAVLHAIAHAQFVREYFPTPNANLSFECIAKAQSGNYFIAGLQDTSVYVAEVAANGNIVREKLIGLGINNSTNFYRLNAMIVDSDFNIVIVGLVRPAGKPLRAFLMKLSPVLSVLLHVVYTNNNTAYEMAFTDVKDYRVNGPNDAYYVTGYSDDPSNQDAVIMKLNRTTGAILTTFNGQPLPNSTRDLYASLLLDISGNPAVPSSIFVTGGLSSGDVSTIRPWVSKHNIATLAFMQGERYLMDVQAAQTASLYNVGITKDVPNKSILYSWYGNPTTALGNHTAMGLARVNAGNLTPVWQKRYTITSAGAILPPFLYSVLRKVETDPNGYIAQGMWSDGQTDGGGEIFLLRTNKAGTPQWARQYKGVFNYQPVNSCFLVDGDTVYAIGYKVVAGFTRGVLIKTPLATGSMDTACARLLTIKVADSTFATAGNVAPLALAVKPTGNYYPVNCIVSDGAKPCDGCKAQPLKCSDTFTVTAVHHNIDPFYTISVSAFSPNTPTCNSKFVISMVNYAAGFPYPDVPGTASSRPYWNITNGNFFNGYTGLDATTPPNPNGSSAKGIFNYGTVYRVRHIDSGFNNCGIMHYDTLSKIVLIAPGIQDPKKPDVLILDEGKADLHLGSYIINPYEKPIELARNNGAATVYPNPADAFVTFSTAALKNENLVLKIVDGNGRTLSAASIAGKKQATVATGNWASGLYMYSVTSNGKVVAQGKFVVLH